MSTLVFFPGPLGRLAGLARWALFIAPIMASPGSAWPAGLAGGVRDVGGAPPHQV